MRAVAVAAAQRGGRGEDDVMPERSIKELQGAFTGYSLLHLSRPLVLAFSRSLFDCEYL